MAALRSGSILARNRSETTRISASGAPGPSQNTRPRILPSAVRDRRVRVIQIFTGGCERDDRRMTDFFDGRSGIGVHQKRKVFELRNQYTLTDESGVEAGRVEQAKQSALAWLARLGTSLDTMLPTMLTVTDASERRMLVLEKPWFTWVTVHDADDRTIGVIGRRFRVGKPVYTLTAHGGAEVGEIRAEDWRSRKFEVVDTAGMNLGRVTKQWRGLFSEVVTDATHTPSPSSRRRPQTSGH